MTALILTTIAIAILSAWYDKQVIADGYEIMHTPGWIIRAALVTIAAFVFGHPWMVLGLWGLFSAVFRFALNTLRGLDWRYVSPSNWYDWMFIWTMTPRPSEGGKLRHLFNAHTRRGALYVHAQFMQHRPDWVVVIHRAGTLAYAVEVVAFVVVLLLHLK